MLRAHNLLSIAALLACGLPPSAPPPVEEAPTGQTDPRPGPEATMQEPPVEAPEPSPIAQPDHHFRYIEVTDQEIDLVGVRIDYETAKVQLRPQTAPVLEEVARAMKAYPHRKLRVEVHTDNRGSSEFNLELSQGRADETRERLISLGVEPERIRAVGYGETRPISHPPRGELRRRTEFHWE